MHCTNTRNCECPVTDKKTQSSLPLNDIIHAKVAVNGGCNNLLWTTEFGPDLNVNGAFIQPLNPDIEHSAPDSSQLTYSFPILELEKLAHALWSQWSKSENHLPTLSHKTTCNEIPSCDNSGKGLCVLEGSGADC